MPKKKDVESTELPKMRPALTPTARDNQMIALAVDLAEKQLRDGTASAQVIVHYLKLGTEREKLELETLRHQNKLIEAKTKSYQSEARYAELLNKAMRAFSEYSPHGNDRDEELFRTDSASDF